MVSMKSTTTYSKSSSIKKLLSLYLTTSMEKSSTYCTRESIEWTKRAPNSELFMMPPQQKGATSHPWPTVLTGDLKKAFLQIRIKEEERDALRFHWKPPNSDLSFHAGSLWNDLLTLSSRRSDKPAPGHMRATTSRVHQGTSRQSLCWRFGHRRVDCQGCCIQENHCNRSVWRRYLRNPQMALKRTWVRGASQLSIQSEI